MSKSILLLSVIFFVSSLNNCLGQTSRQISDPVVELRNDLIYIIYDILNSTSSEKYDVRVEITDSEGERIIAKAIYGDIGENIIGGGPKTIIWNYSEDQVALTTEIFFQVYAVEIIEHKENIPEKDGPSREFKTAGLIAQSVALPGLGLTRLSHGKPHWIKGVVGYGCLAGSIILNRAAIGAFNHYLSPSDSDYAPELYSTSVRQDNVSEILAYTAIGIWVTDIVWTMVRISRINKTTYSFEKGGISFGAGYESSSGTPLVALRYRF